MIFCSKSYYEAPPVFRYHSVVFSRVIHELNYSLLKAGNCYGQLRGISHFVRTKMCTELLRKLSSSSFELELRLQNILLSSHGLTKLLFSHNLHALCMTSLLIPRRELFRAVVCHSIKEYFLCRLDSPSKMKK